MAEIIEIVLEQVQLERVVPLLFKAIKSSNLRDYYISTDSSAIDFRSQAQLLSSIKNSSDGAFYFNFLDFSLNSVLLPLGIQLYKYGGAYDLNLHFEEKQLEQSISLLELQGQMQVLAEELGATNYYCGYEPAADEETRFFSGNTLGPLKSW